MLARGCPGPVELALLDEEHEWPLGVLSAPDGRFAGGNLVERAAEMNGRRLQAAGISPRDRPVERPVDLEGAGAVAVAPEPADIARGQDRCADVGELRRAGVEEDDTGGGDVRERSDVPSSLDAAAERPQIGCERPPDRL